MRIIRSIRFRIVAGVGVTLAVVLGLGSVQLVDMVERQLVDEAASSLQESVDELVGSDGNLLVPPESLLTVDDSEYLVQLLDEGEEVVVAVLHAGDREPLGELIVDPNTGEVIELESFGDDEIPEGDEDLLAEAALEGVRVGEGERLAVSTTLSSVRTAVATLRRALWLVVPAMVALGVLVSWLWVGRSLRPVAAISDRAAEIGTDTMSERVPVPSSGDEVERLAEVINGMLERIESGVERQRQFVSDASHELRTPLATVRAGAEMIELEGGERWAPAASDMVADIDRMDRLIGDLLALARLEGAEQSREEVDLRSLVVAEVEARRDDRISVVPGPPVVTRAEQIPLERAVANLVDNAARHAEDAVEVTISASGAGDDMVIAVEDDGPGVAAGDRQRVFDRFVRLDEGRTRDAGGAGLGLAIVQGVARTHGGSARVTDRADGGRGARFELRLPRVTGSD